MWDDMSVQMSIRTENSTLSLSQQCPSGESSLYQDCGRGVLWAKSKVVSLNQLGPHIPPKTQLH